jgi:hypothetical protein
VPVQAVGRCIQLTVDKPAGMGQLPVEHLVPGRDPLELVRLLFPEVLPVAPGAVQCITCSRAGSKRRRRRKTALLGEKRIDLIVHGDGVRVSRNLRDLGQRCKSKRVPPATFAVVRRGVRRASTARVGRRLRKRLRFQAFSAVAPVSPFPNTRARGRMRPSANPPDKSTPGVIRGRKTRGLTWSRTWLR